MVKQGCFDPPGMIPGPGRTLGPSSRQETDDAGCDSETTAPFHTPEAGMLMGEMVRAGKQNLLIYRPLPLKPGVQSQAQWLSACGKLTQEFEASVDYVVKKPTSKQRQVWEAR